MQYFLNNYYLGIAWMLYFIVHNFGHKEHSQSKGFWCRNKDGDEGIKPYI